MAEDDLWTVGRSAWPDLEVPEPVFAAYLAQRHGAVQRAGDLYLACACAHQVPGAMASFERCLLSKVPAYLAKMNLGETAVAEIRQAVQEKLFVRGKRSGPKVLEYSGKGDLSAWMNVVTIRVALNYLHDRKRKSELLAVIQRELSTQQEQNPELEHLKRHFLPEVKAAYQAAFAALSRKQAKLLHLYYVRGLKVEQIGVKLGVHHGTVCRGAEGARKVLRQETERILQEHLHVSKAECESIIKLVHSQIDLRLSGVLPAGTVSLP